MTFHFAWPRLLVLLLFIVPVTYVHFRGNVKHSFLRQLIDHSAFLAPYNVLMYLFSRVSAKPILDAGEFAESAILRDHWETLRDEGLMLLKQGYIKAPIKNNDIGFNSFFKQGWTRFYVKWYDEILPSARSLCPKTTQLAEDMRDVRAVMFVVLPGNSRLNPHRDPFAGSLRYHLGLVTPNSDDCRLFVDDETYSWRDGKDVLFDETYIHWVENKTDRYRLILFCDVDRPVKVKFVQRLNRVVSTLLGKATATQNLDGERVGGLNKIYTFIHEIDQFRRRIKNANRVLYRFAKLVIVGITLYAFVSI